MEASLKPKSRRWPLLAGVALIAVALLLFAYAQFREDQEDAGGLFFEIPYGAQQRVPAGLLSAVDMPTEIVFAKGETARITVVNNDTVMHLAGPFLVGPGQTYIQNFPNPGVFPIDCTVNDDESIVVTVEE
ncbi:MAG: hypothetical protein IT334_00125 [Thermomicrobiales bacterium]|nr:hypothetical protein [Thermomicrobiales bacterium]